MPLTRRVQVFISEEISAALDRIVARGLTQKEAVEQGLLLLDASEPSGPPVFDESVQSSIEIKPTLRRETDFGELTDKPFPQPGETFSVAPGAKIPKPRKEHASPDGRKPVSLDARKLSESMIADPTSEELREALRQVLKETPIKPCPRHSPKFCEPDCRYRK